MIQVLQYQGLNTKTEWMMFSSRILRGNQGNLGACWNEEQDNSLIFSANVSGDHSGIIHSYERQTCNGQYILQERNIAYYEYV